MFKRKYLKQLQDVQTRIKNHKAKIASLKIPTPSCKILHELCDWIKFVADNNIKGIDAFEYMVAYKLKVDTFEYLGQLGNYFVNVAEYERSKSIYNNELIDLQKEERRLKDKLGID